MLVCALQDPVLWFVHLLVHIALCVIWFSPNGRQIPSTTQRGTDCWTTSKQSKTQNGLRIDYNLLIITSGYRPENHKDRAEWVKIVQGKHRDNDSKKEVK